MFITRKQLNERIAEAVKREHERRDIWERISRAEDSLYRDMQRLDERISRLEQQTVYQKEECKAVKFRE